jgi:hypothetical protein
VHEHRRLQILPGGCRQLLGHHQVPVGAGGLSEGGVHEESMRSGPGLPDLVTAATQQSDGSAQIRECFVVPAEHPEQIAASGQDSSGRDPFAVADRLTQRGESLLRLAAEAEGEPEGGLDVRDAIHVRGLLRQPQRKAELGNGLELMAGVAQHDGPRLMSDRRGNWFRRRGEDCVSGGEGLGGSRDRQRQQVFGSVPRPAG